MRPRSAAAPGRGGRAAETSTDTTARSGLHERGVDQGPPPAPIRYLDQWAAPSPRPRREAATATPTPPAGGHRRHPAGAEATGNRSSADRVGAVGGIDEENGDRHGGREVTLPTGLDECQSRSAKAGTDQPGA